MKIGKDPDYRFSLANERTFLAWIRTSVAFLAAALGLDLLSSTHVTPNYMEWAAPGLAVTAMFTGIWAFLRWYQNEKAIRLQASFRYSKSLVIMMLVVSFLSLAMAFFTL